MTDNDRTDRVEAGQRWQHAKRGTSYDVIGLAELQMSTDLVDGASLVVYRGDDNKLWAREEGEFTDGRFHRLAALSGAGGEGDAPPAALEAAREWIVDRAAKDEDPEQWEIVRQIDAALATHPGDHPGDAGEGHGLGPSATTLEDAPGGFDPVHYLVASHVYLQQGDAQIFVSLNQARRLSLALSPTSAPAGDGARREGLARIIDPGAYDHHGGVLSNWRAARASEKAGRIAALSAQATDREKVLEEAGQTVREALMDSQYLAGAKAGWNAAQADDPEAAYAALVKSRKGHLAGFCDARRALAQAPSEARR